MKISDYGDMLGQVTGKKVLVYELFGSYQGEWIAVLDAGFDIEIWKGYYGSCSGCDWIKSERSWETSEVSDKKAKEFFKEDRPFCVIPKSTMNDVSLETFTEMLPANIRTGIYEFEPKRLYDAIKLSLK